jgi:hypothetical protein
MGQSVSPANSQSLLNQVWPDLTPEAQHQIIGLIANLVFKWLIQPTPEVASEEIHVTPTPQC